MLAEEAIQDFLKTHSLPVALILPGWMFGPYDAAPTDSGRLVLDFLAGKLPGIIEGGSTVVDAATWPRLWSQPLSGVKAAGVILWPVNSNP